ncbi:hypothetical protein HaLaN_19712 [Haematococcus lacustris]|uniref:Uncharacterized protein n=1 Tax=Haematococcus lacustris TaxID=44745 RepID=A0A699ZMC6_HAELA|nr:hypothetical protein HaLaN_19712 [Haematococcus lacustris]
MLRVMARTAAAGAHAYTTLAPLLDRAPDHGTEPRSLGKEKVLDQPPSAQQLAPLALDLVWGMEGMLQGSRDRTRLQGCRALADSHKFLLLGRQQAPPSMSPEAERLLACLTLVLTVALPLDTWLAAIASVQADEVEVIEQGLCDLLTRVEPQQVWSWQALAAGTPAEASLASVLQGAAKKLQLPHLVAPAPQGWQPGRLTLDRGRGPPELMALCFPKL